MAISAERLPGRRPAGLRTTSLDLTWWRLDERPPADWRWEGFPAPRNRFDVPGHRVRYAARTERGAFREHFDGSARRVTADHLGLQVVRLTGRVRVVDLRSERVLDTLGVDAEIGAGRSDRAMRTCWALAERLLDWYPDLGGIAYLSRTTPQTSSNLAFFAHSPLRAEVVGRLGDRAGLLTQLVLDDGFRLDLPGWV